MNNFQPTEGLILPYIKGKKLNEVMIELHTLSQLNDCRALSFFQNQISSDEQTKILSFLSHDLRDISLADYLQWRQNLGLDDTCIHLLEYLAFKGFHRFNYLIKQIYKIKAPWKLHYFYLSSMTGIVIAGIYFTQNQHAWTSFLNFFKTTLPDLFLQSCDWVLKPENLALLMLVYQILSYLTQAYQILADNSSRTSDKISKLCHLSLYFALTSSAQIFIFLNLPIAYMSGLLFIFANLIDLSWSLITCYFLKKGNSMSNTTMILEEDLHTSIRLKEQMIHYEQMTKQLYVEGASLFLSLIAGTISFIFAPNIACIATLCASFQFLLNLTKSHYFEIIEKNYAEKLQDKIKELYDKSPNPSSSVTSLVHVPVFKTA